MIRRTALEILVSILLPFGAVHVTPLLNQKKKNREVFESLNGHIFYISLVDSNNYGKFVENPTIATGDFKVSKHDYDKPVNLEITPEATGKGIVKVTLQRSEMSEDRQAIVLARDLVGDEWQTVRLYLDNPP